MRRAAGVIALALALSLAGCGDSTGRVRSQPGLALGSAETRYLEPAVPRTSDGSLLLQPAADATGMSVAVAGLHYESAPAVVLATDAADPAALELADSYGIPVLALPAESTPEQEAVVAGEVARLGATLALPVGRDVPESVTGALAVPADPAAVKLPQAAQAGDPPPWVALISDDETAGLVRPLAEREGGQVVVAAQPGASGAAIEALSASPDAPVVAFGPGFPDEATLNWQIATARTGVTLPGGDTQTIEGDKLYVALYGHPGAPSLGLLGEQGVDATVARAEEHAAMYDHLTEATVVPTLEIIVTVASGSPGSDGNYSNEFPSSHYLPLIEAAHEHGLYVILDLQPGRTDFLTQAKMYEDLLRLPYVGLALDPEWRLGPDQVHLRQIGSVQAAEVNEVTTWLADLVRENNLPQKLFILHSFTVNMVQSAPEVDVSRPEIAYMVHVDGQGGHGAKVGTWNRLREYLSQVPYWGWKNFYDEDVPRIMTPEETMSVVQPTPLLITYQ
ncbi:MAG: hypothetical protein Q4G64_00970 [bacterium]|nr:hypothetical protein [bacterium]